MNIPPAVQSFLDAIPADEKSYIDGELMLSREGLRMFLAMVAEAHPEKAQGLAKIHAMAHHGLYEFQRAEGGYTLAMASDASAIENARINPGTLKVVKVATGATVWTLHSAS